MICLSKLNKWFQINIAKWFYAVSCTTALTKLMTSFRLHYYSLEKISLIHKYCSLKMCNMTTVPVKSKSTTYCMTCVNTISCGPAVSARHTAALQPAAGRNSNCGMENIHWGVPGYWKHLIPVTGMAWGVFHVSDVSAATAPARASPTPTPLASRPMLTRPMPLISSQDTSPMPRRTQELLTPHRKLKRKTSW